MIGWGDRRDIIGILLRIEDSSWIFLSDINNDTFVVVISGKLFHVGELVVRIFEVDASIVNINDLFGGFVEGGFEELFPDGEVVAREGF